MIKFETHPKYLLCNKGDGFPCPSRSCRPANTVDVVFGMGGDV